MNFRFYCLIQSVAISLAFLNPKAGYSNEGSAIRGELEDGTFYTVVQDDLLEDLSKKVDWTSDGKHLVVDNKIWMTEPNWINKRSNGIALGAILTTLGIGSMAIASPVIITVAGGVTACSGLYFLVSNYWKDPSYIDLVRKDDLAKGFVHAYQMGRAGLTLTPYERRVFFLQEMVDAPHLLPQSPILLLSDFFQMNDPVFAQIFTTDEMNILIRIKRDFIQQRNDYIQIKRNLDRELEAIIAPYANLRDADLLRAKDIYNQNYYVVCKTNLKFQRDAAIADIDKAFKAGELTIEEKEVFTKQAQDFFETSMNSSDFQIGLNKANVDFSIEEMKIQNHYAFQVEIAKQSIQYNQRMEFYKNGEESLIVYFNRELVNLLASFPIYHTIFPDYLDLRIQ